jgi:hypothetical protein
MGVTSFFIRPRKIDTLTVKLKLDIECYIVTINK